MPPRTRSTRSGSATRSRARRPRPVGGRVLVIGGYGAVGVTVTRVLAAGLPDRVVVAGRDPVRARRTGTGLGAHAGVALDITDLDAVERAVREHEVSTVVLCVEPADGALARRLFGLGVHLVDVGPTYELLAQVERAAPVATEAGATGLISVGLAPGLTNLLARRAVTELGGADRVDITLLIGAAEEHGPDVVRWTVDQLAASSRAPEPAPPLAVELPGYGRRTAHPFPFSDQYSLRRTLGVPAVVTRMALDPAYLGTSVFAMRRLGVYKLTRWPWVRRAMIASLGGVAVGGDGFVVRVDAHRAGRRVSYALTGREQSRCTALVAAHATRHLLSGALEPGVRHVDEIPALDGVPELLAPEGYALWTPDRLG
ncbi:MAG TPA: NAD-dependent epimerase/dehydratase family protein [Pseudonocardiaceae bacterium]